MWLVLAFDVWSATTRILLLLSHFSPTFMQTIFLMVYCLLGWCTPHIFTCSEAIRCHLHKFMQQLSIAQGPFNWQWSNSCSIYKASLRTWLSEADFCVLASLVCLYKLQRSWPANLILCKGEDCSSSVVGFRFPQSFWNRISTVSLIGQNAEAYLVLLYRGYGWYSLLRLRVWLLYTLECDDIRRVL